MTFDEFLLANGREMLIGMNVFTEFKGAFTENFVLQQIKSLEFSRKFIAIGIE